MVQRLHRSLVYPVPCQILVKLFNTIRLRGPNLVKRSRSPCQIQLIYPTWQMQLPAHLVPSMGLIRAVMLLADRFTIHHNHAIEWAQGSMLTWRHLANTRMQIRRPMENQARNERPQVIGSRKTIESTLPLFMLICPT